jgi:hypothetical protein
MTWVDELKKRARCLKEERIAEEKKSEKESKKRQEEFRSLQLQYAEGRMKKVLPIIKKLLEGAISEGGCGYVISRFDLGERIIDEQYAGLLCKMLRKEGLRAEKEPDVYGFSISVSIK